MAYQQIHFSQNGRSFAESAIFRSRTGHKPAGLLCCFLLSATVTDIVTPANATVVCISLLKSSFIRYVAMLGHFHCVSKARTFCSQSPPVVIEYSTELSPCTGMRVWIVTRKSVHKKGCGCECMQRDKLGDIGGRRSKTSRETMRYEEAILKKVGRLLL